MMDTVSVIIPFHNRIDWVKEAVHSVLRQTYKEIEIILIDDGSTENVNPIKKIVNSSVVYFHQDKKGPSVARNMGIKIARGKYVAFLDSDDLFLPEKIEIQLDYMKKNPEICLSHTSYERIDLDGNYIENVSSGFFTGNVYPEIILSCPIATPTVMVQREILICEKFNANVSIGEDVILWSQIAKQGKILGIDKPLSKVRMHRFCTATVRERSLIGKVNIIEHIIRFDKHLDLLFYLKAESTRHSSLGSLYALRGMVAKSIKYFLLGILFQPHKIKIYLVLFYYILPKRLRTLHKWIKKKIENVIND